MEEGEESNNGEISLSNTGRTARSESRTLGDGAGETEEDEGETNGEDIINKQMTK
jgi:hypothetical protein